MASDWTHLQRRLRKQGFEIKTTGGGKLRVTSTDGQSVVIPKTPSDYRSQRNAEQDLKKIGYRRK